MSFAGVVGRSLDEFIELSDSGDRKAAQESLPRFLERRRWTGVVRAKVKRRGSTHYFDCVLHAIVRNDVVHGISGLARDITANAKTKLDSQICLRPSGKASIFARLTTISLW